jgi:uncharacterized protein YjbJ (UPF0337 family)
MGADDKLQHKGEELKGKAKEAYGEHTGDPDLADRGRGEQVSSHVKQAGDKVKDAAEHVKDAFSE